MRACWHNASDLVQGSETLLQAGLHAPALSLSVLALEEMGKLIATDGLLFAHPNDSKADRSSRAQKQHAIKLLAVPVLPLFLLVLGRSDPRFGNDRDGFDRELTLGLKNLASDIQAVSAALEGQSMDALDVLKQQGLYVRLDSQGFALPRDMIDSELAKKVCQLAWRATTILDLVLGNGNLERYIERAKSIRSQLSEADHQEFESLAAELVQRQFLAKDE